MHFIRVSADVAHGIDLGDVAGRVDQEGDPLRVVGVRLLWAAFYSVGSSHRPIDIAKQGKTELLGVGKRLVLGRRVKTGPQDLGAESGELWASITEAPPLAGSAPRGRLGKPPQHDPGAPQIAQADHTLLFVGEREIQGGAAGADHITSIRRQVAWLDEDMLKSGTRSIGMAARVK